MEKKELDLIKFSLNQTCNDAHTKLQGKNLGDLERQMVEKTKADCKVLLMKLDEGKTEATEDKLLTLVAAFRKVVNVVEEFEADAIGYCEKNEIEKVTLLNKVVVFDVISEKHLTVTAVQKDGTLEFEDNDGFSLKCDDVPTIELCAVIEEYVKSKNN